MKKIVIIGIASIILAGLGVFTVRFFSGEDNWICKNGQWVKHGNPNIEKPTASCGSAFINGQNKKNGNEASIPVPENNDQVIGGPCSYEKFDGKCEIVDIAGKSTIKFKFKPDEKMNLDNVGWVNEADILEKVYEENINNVGSIKKGGILDCRIELIAEGTCTPTIFSFK